MVEEDEVELCGEELAGLLRVEEVTVRRKVTQILVSQPLEAGSLSERLVEIGHRAIGLDDENLLQNGAGWFVLDRTTLQRQSARERRKRWREPLRLASLLRIRSPAADWPPPAEGLARSRWRDEQRALRRRHGLRARAKPRS